jgi:hypothetical protein
MGKGADRCAGGIRRRGSHCCLQAFRGGRWLQFSLREMPRNGDWLVSTRRLLYLAIFCSALVSEAFAQATSVTLQLFPFTGEVRLLNENPDPLEFILYSLKSTSGSLNSSPAVWKSISDTYDVSGNGFIDPTSNWFKLSTSSSDLAEAVTEGTGGVLPAYRAISLGNIWDPNAAPTPDIMPVVTLASDVNATVIIREMIDGDYFRDGSVDSLDYEFWKASFGLTGGAGYFADGNIDGIVDAADYTIWRDNFGLALPASGDEPLEVGGGSLSVGAVPEPASLVMLIVASFGLAFRRFRRAASVAS